MMGGIKRQVNAEIKQLPFMLGRLLGGIAAAIGFAAAVVIMTGKHDPMPGDILSSLLPGTPIC